MKQKHYGIGTNIYKIKGSANKKTFKFYRTWSNMLERCYDEKYTKKHPTYKKCTVCEEWRDLSGFKQWFDENYIDGWHLDKDILIKGNKVYSPNTCCFVPQEINKLFEKSNGIRGIYPIGVRLNKKKNKFEAYISKKNKFISLGLYSNVNDAFLSYKKEKEEYIKELANKYKGQLPSNVYNVLINYEVDIND